MEVKEILQKLTLEEKASLCSGQDFWHTKAVERLDIPEVMMCDGPNGLRKQEEEADHLGMNESIKAVCFPTASAIAASFDVELARRLGEILGEECQAENVGLLLGPGVNIKRSPLCGRNFEYYSEDPFQSGQMASAYIEGIQSRGVGACIKHFAANNQETHRQTGDSIVDERTLNEIYLASFEEAVKKAKPWGVMCSYNRVNGTFSAENRQLLTDVLRDDWKYDGMVVTDWGAVKDRVKGIKVGLDLEMPGGKGSLGNDAKIIKAVQDGSLSMEELDQAVFNVLCFVQKTMEKKRKEYQFDREKDYEAAKQMAEECAVLLKNKNQLLPLEETQKILFVGGFAEKPRIQGSGSSYINSTKVPSIKELISERKNIRFVQGYEISAINSAFCSYAGAVQNEKKRENTLLNEAIEAAKNSDVTVIFAGLPGNFEAEGADRTHLNLPEEQNQLIEEICKIQPNTVIVLSNGAPISMPWAEDVSSILEMYLAGDGASEAILDLLFGRANPSGKLAESFPLRLEDTPSYLNFPGERGVVRYKEDIFVGYRYYDKKNMPVLFPFGHGLSYTTFEYSDLRISKQKMKDTETLEVSVKVTNTGKVGGKEVVQLYVGAKESQVRRPVRELKGFQKIKLEAGESKVLQFLLNERSFAYYEPIIHDWFVESGFYEISVGTSSRNLSLYEMVEVEGTRCLPLSISMETSIGTLIEHPATAPVMEQMIQKSMEKRYGGNMETTAQAIGGSREELIAGAMEMPLGALVSFGTMSEDQLNSLILMLQGCADSFEK